MTVLPEPASLLSAASAAAIPVIRGVGESSFENPTPCSEYQVKDLLNHLFQVVVNFQSLAAKQPVSWDAKPDFIHGPWQDRFEAETQRLVTAWSDPAALEGVSSGMGLPQEVLARMILLDLTVHAWDLATATGQDFTPAPAAVPALLSLVDQMGDTARQMKVFGEPHPVPGDASGFVKLLGRTGRDPFIKLTW